MLLIKIISFKTNNTDVDNDFINNLYEQGNTNTRDDIKNSKKLLKFEIV